jgi:hypothetical protein
MRILCLLLVGVVVGWAASDVDWTRDAVGQTMNRSHANRSEIILSHHNNLIADDYSRVERFCPAAYGDGSGAGCFIVDTMTGRTWHATPGDGVKELPKKP